MDNMDIIFKVLTSDSSIAEFRVLQNVSEYTKTPEFFQRNLNRLKYFLRKSTSSSFQISQFLTTFCE